MQAKVFVREAEGSQAASKLGPYNEYGVMSRSCISRISPVGEIN
jgi:hypothetical protein